MKVAGPLTSVMVGCKSITIALGGYYPLDKSGEAGGQEQYKDERIVNHVLRSILFSQNVCKRWTYQIRGPTNRQML